MIQHCSSGDRNRDTRLGPAYDRACEIRCFECLCMFCVLNYLRTFFLSFLLTAWSTVLLKKLTDPRLVKKFPTFYGTPSFITAFTSARHLSLSWASSIQSILPHPSSWRSILLLSSHLRLCLPSGLFPSGFPTKNPVYASPLRHIATCPAHPILLDFIPRAILGNEYRSLSFSLCSFHPSLITSSPLGPNMFFMHIKKFKF